MSKERGPVGTILEGSKTLDVLDMGGGMTAYWLAGLDGGLTLALFSAITYIAADKAQEALNHNN